MSASNFASSTSANENKASTEETDAFSSCGPIFLQYVTKNCHRRASLDVEHPIKASVCFDRRSSIGTLRSLNLSRRLSLGEEGLKLRPSGSSSSINEARLRRRSLDTCPGVYDPRRRSSLGAESLIEYDLEEENESSPDLRTDIPSDALLGLQYADDVFAVKRDLEVKYHPRKCLESQPQVTEPVRCATVNWLVKINRKLKFGAETVFLAVHLLDRFLAASAIASDCVQLLAVCSLFVAAKMEEIKVPGMSAFVRFCSTPYQKHHFRRMEILLLTKLGFYLHAPSSWYFINHLALKACQLGYLDRRVTRVARRVAELCLCQYRISQYLPSVQAVASFLSAVAILEPELGETLTSLLEDKDEGEAHRMVSKSNVPCVFCISAYECEGCFSDGSVATSAIAQSEREPNHLVDIGVIGGEENEAPLEDEGNDDKNNCERPAIEDRVFEDAVENGEDFKTDPKLVSALVLAIKCLYSPLEQEDALACWRMMVTHLLPYEELLKHELICNDPTVSAIDYVGTNGAERTMLPCSSAATARSRARDAAAMSSEVVCRSQLLGLNSTTQTEVAASKESRSSSSDRRDSGIVGMEGGLQQCFIASPKDSHAFENC